MSPPTKDEALSLLRAGHGEVSKLVDSLSPRAATTPGLGGGDWSAKDLLGHLTSWEEYALAAMGAWLDGVPAPIDQALHAQGLDQINAAAVALKAKRSYPRIRREFADVHEQLVRALRAVPPAAWDMPPTVRMKRPLGRRIGGILGGPGGPFTHDAAHLPDLRAFVDGR